MSQADKLFSGYQQFVDKLDQTHYFVKFFPNCNLIQTWLVVTDNALSCDFRCYRLNPRNVDQDILEYLDVWKQLPVEIQTEIQNGILAVQQENQEKMATARAARKPRGEYADLPRQVACTADCCDTSDYMPPGTLVKKAGIKYLEGDERAAALKEFLDAYQCSGCQPRKRGKARNPLYKNIPRTVNCNGKDCGKECTINAKSVYEQTGGDAKQIKAYCDEYLCRSCNPEWGSWLKGKSRGRKPKAENVGFPKQVQCVGCSKPVHIVPQNIRDKAEKMGISTEELLDNYKCRSCGGVVRGPNRKKRKTKKAKATA